MAGDLFLDLDKNMNWDLLDYFLDFQCILCICCQMKADLSGIRNSFRRSSGKIYFAHHCIFRSGKSGRSAAVCLPSKLCTLSLLIRKSRRTIRTASILRIMHHRNSYSGRCTKNLISQRGTGRRILGKRCITGHLYMSNTLRASDMLPHKINNFQRTNYRNISEGMRNSESICYRAAIDHQRKPGKQFHLCMSCIAECMANKLYSRCYDKICLGRHILAEFFFIRLELLENNQCMFGIGLG